MGKPKINTQVVNKSDTNLKLAVTFIAIVYPRMNLLSEMYVLRKREQEQEWEKNLRLKVYFLLLVYPFPRIGPT